MEELDVSLNEITPEGVAVLAQVLPMCNIKTLNISKNLLGDESLIMIADNGTNHLEKLDVSSSRIQDHGLLHFIERLENFSNL